jgi:hypothetical protein
MTILLQSSFRSDDHISVQIKANVSQRQIQMMGTFVVNATNRNGLGHRANFRSQLKKAAVMQLLAILRTTNMMVQKMGSAGLNVSMVENVEKARMLKVVPQHHHHHHHHRHQRQVCLASSGISNTVSAEKDSQDHTANTRTSNVTTENTTASMGQHVYHPQIQVRV